MVLEINFIVMMMIVMLMVTMTIQIMMWVTINDDDLYTTELSA